MRNGASDKELEEIIVRTWKVRKDKYSEERATFSFSKKEKVETIVKDVSQETGKKPDITKIVPIILAGGSGSRLWPLSRNSFPKQFLNLIQDDEYSMLQKTCKRIESIENICKPIVICNEEHRFIVAHKMKDIYAEPSEIVLEPEGKNTTPAITIAALKVLEKYSNTNIDPAIQMIIIVGVLLVILNAFTNLFLYLKSKEKAERDSIARSIYQAQLTVLLLMILTIIFFVALGTGKKNPPWNEVDGWDALNTTRGEVFKTSLYIIILAVGTALVNVGAGSGFFGLTK